MFVMEFIEICEKWLESSAILSSWFNLTWSPLSFFESSKHKS